jgi:hypothetical protein
MAMTDVSWGVIPVANFAAQAWDFAAQARAFLLTLTVSQVAFREELLSRQLIQQVGACK